MNLHMPPSYGYAHQHQPYASHPPHVHQLEPYASHPPYAHQQQPYAPESDVIADRSYHNGLDSEHLMTKGSLTPRGF